MNDQPSNHLEGIAIVGLAGKFPGADDLNAFWQRLMQAEDGIATFAKEDLSPEEPANDPDYVPRRGVLHQPEWFDASFFGMSPKEAEVTDPQQRLFLEACYHALEDASVDPTRSNGSIGVYAGMSSNSYFQSQVEFNSEIRQQAGPELVMIGNEKDYLATRVAYKLNLRGPALNIYTACSTSLVAICQAVNGLQSFQCDVALAGGVSVKFPQERGYLYQEGGIVSPDGHCRTFDERAQGTIFSNGLGVVVLKRIEDAVRDGDRIYAVIKGAAINNDGADKASFTAPSVGGHAEVISLAQALGGIEPDTIDYIEAHGTATPIGDPIEIAGLTEAFRAGGCTRTGFCAIGSAKSNFGHMDAAAGVVGLIKTALALYHRTIPASLHFTKANQTLGLEESPFYVNTKTTAWKRQDHPRRAGVSSFGVGGTNAHVVLEEAPEAPASDAGRSSQILLLSAKNEPALDQLREQLAQHLSTEINLADVAATLQSGRQVFSHRLALAASTREEAMEALAGAAGKDYFTQLQAERKVPLAFLFPGQGSQHIGMGASLAQEESAYRDALLECCELLKPLLDIDLSTLLNPPQEKAELAERQLAETRYTQPALFVTEYALAQLLMSWGVKPAIMLGHSAGEYVAACLAGVMSLSDALRLVVARGRCLWECEPGAMLGVRADEARVRSLLVPGIDLAAVNSPNLMVVSGALEQIGAMEAVFGREEISCRRLVTSHAFHSSMMEPAMERFRAAFTGVTLQAPSIPYVSNVTGQRITDEEATSPDYYLRHIRETVRFADGIGSLLESGSCAILEVGPGQALATLARQHPQASTASTILSSLPPAKAGGVGETAELMRAMGRLWLGGAELDWDALHAGEVRQRVTLPGYPFQRQRYCAARSLPEGTTRVGESALICGAGGVTKDLNPSSANLEPAVVAGVSRLDHLLGELRTQLHKASGIDLSSAPAAASFFDLGFDSLFLTQASIFLRKHFGVKITFRQIAEELGSLSTLAEYLDANLPQDKFQPVTLAQPQTLIPVSGTSPAGDRLAVIEQAIGELRRDLLAPLAGIRKQYSVRATSQNVNSDKKIAFGPFRPLQTAKDGSLTETQRSHLDELLAAYTAKTKGSKAFTQEHRHHFADPRAVAGFNHLWKEAVYPLIVDRSQGGRIWDVDANEYVDITQGFGVGFLGHRASFVMDAVKAQLDKGIEIGPTNPLVGEVATLFLEFTGHERVSFCNTGSEALMAAIRTSRTVTGRDKIVMFAGAYHGIMDEVLVRPMMDGDQLHTIPIAPGIPEAVGENILVLDFDNPESLEIIRDHAQEIAAVLVETVQSRRPELQPAEFLHTLRAITAEHGIALVLDEVVNGFRIHPRGAAGHFGIEADIATYGKIIGGGFPIGVVAGKRKFLDALDGGQWQYGDDSGPEVGVTFFAGTFVRHPLALAAAKAVLTHLKEKGPQLQTWMNERTTKFVGEMNDFCQEVGVPIRLTHFSSYYFVNFAPQLKYTELLFLHLRLRGIHAWAGRSSFLCTQHTDEDIAQVVEAFKESVRALQAGGFLPTLQDNAQPVPEAASLEVVATFMPSYAPLTAAQQELLLASALSEQASTACHESVSVEIKGDLQPETLHQALGMLLERHVALRASFDENGEGMHIAANVRLPLPLLDFSELSGTEQELRLKEVGRQQFLTPFSLKHGPMLRAALANLGEQKHQLLLTAHHIICDGWSFGVLLQELPQAYELVQQGKLFPAPAPRFDAYAADERMQRASGEGASSKAYWLQKLANPPAPLALPTDLARSEPSYDTFSVSLTLPAGLLEQVKHIAKERRLTVFQIMLGAWEVLLHRLTGQDDFLVGVPFAGQAATGQAGLVGHCVQFLPLRAKVHGSTKALGFMEQVRQQVMEALDHQDCTLGEILNELKGITGQERQQFVPTAFSLESMGSDTIEMSGLSFTTKMNPKLRSNFALTLYAYQGTEDLRLLCAARSQLFREETIQQWLRHYQRLLQSLCAHPEMEISRLPMLTTEQRSELLHGFNANGRRAGGDICLHTWFEQQALQHPQALALTCGSQSLTYGEVNARANQLAHALIDAGVRPGMLVGLCLERANPLVVAILGILKAGAAYVPMDLGYPAARLAFMMEDAAAPVLVAQQSLSKQLPQHAGRTLFIDDALSDFPTTNPQTSVIPDDVAYVIYTSGSTGKPKGCRITHRNVARLMQSTEAWFHFNSRDVWTMFHSAAFDFSVWEIWGSLLYGGRLVVVPFDLARSPDDFYELLAKEKVTVLNQTPSAFKQLMAAEETLSPAPSLHLRYVIFGGEALEMASLQPWFARHGDQQPQLVNMYGITETTVHVTYRPLSAADTSGGSVIGVPIPDLQIYLLDAAGEPVPFGCVGEMYVGGDGLAQGYLNRPELTAERFVPDHLTGRPGTKLYRTGDLARFRPGRELEYLGRADHQVKLRGYRIELGEIESVLLTHPDVRDAAVLPQQNADGETYLAAFVVYDKDLPTSEGLRKHLQAKLPDYMVPAAYVCMESFPLTENGKLDRRALSAPQPEAPVHTADRDRSYVAPRNDFEQRLAAIWQDILRLPAVGSEDNFFEIGGTSLHGLRLFTRIRSDFRVALPLGTLFRAPTLAKLAAVIETSANATRGKVSPLTCIQPSGDELPFFGIHGGDGGALFYKGLLSRFGTERQLYTIESPALVDESLPIESISIPEVAAEYVALIRLAQRRGPYVLGGYSYGGLVALEMAQQLLAAGEEVPLLVMFDTENPNVPAREYTLGERIGVNWRTSRSHNVAGKLLHLGGRFSSGLIQRFRTEAETASARRLLKQGVRAEDERLRYVQIREANIQAAEAYKAAPLATTMLLFRSDEVSDKFDLSEDYGWTSQVDRLIIDRVSGNHLEIFDEPNVSQMADKLRKHLSKLTPSPALT
jgi:amino acid adenylation domain-containing protein